MLLQTKFNPFLAGFAANQFNWGSGNENLGNEVTIISGTQSYKTEIHKDGCTEDQIQFYTPYVSWTEGLFNNYFFIKKWTKLTLVMLKKSDVAISKWH